MVAKASNTNLWTKLAKIENRLVKSDKYVLPKAKKIHAGIVLTLSKFQYPNFLSFSDFEVRLKVPLEHDIGLLVKS